MSLLVTFFRSMLYFAMSIVVSRSAYAKMFTSVKNAPTRFFELNPLGRILNRFTKDANNMDDMICIFIFEFLHVDYKILLLGLHSLILIVFIF